MMPLSGRDIRRRWQNHTALLVLLMLAVSAVLPFVFIVWFVVQKGSSGIAWTFFTAIPKGPGDAGGGMGHAILGSLVMVSLASVLAVPWGMAVGIYLSEYGRGRTATALRFAIDLLTSVPSIIIGIFVYGLLVVRTGFSALAGALALALIMLPVVARSSEEILKLMPDHIREAGLALGLPRWKVILKIVVPGSRAALLPGIMLAVARIFGETAPLLFTSLGNQFYAHTLMQPTAAMPVQIYNLAKSGFADLENQAWTGALVLVVLVVSINLVTRLAMRLPSANR